MSDLSLVDGPVPLLFNVLAVLGGLWLMAGGRRLWLRAVAPALLGGIAGMALLWYLAEEAYGWWDESFPRLLYFWAGGAVAAAILLVPRLLAGRRILGRVATVMAVLCVLLAAVAQANVQYALFPTVASVFTVEGLSAGSITAVVGSRPPDFPAPPATTESNWMPPPDMPAHGSVYRAAIPGTVSGYRGNDAYVYLPPAYLADPEGSNLPVLVLIHGRPGGSDSWTSSGKLAAAMDSYAAAHRGLAPVVVMPDLSMGGASRWPLCLDSGVARSATYLGVDVPAWVRGTLGAGTASKRQWAIGGLSSGGTCALQLAVNFPQAYPTFLDLSGESEPSVHGGRDRLVREYFDGDPDAFAAQNAQDVLARRTFPGTAGRFVAGIEDNKYGNELDPLYAAARKAGMQVRFDKVPGTHSWHMWAAELPRQMPWLMQRTGLVR
ncbi:alpha/beta hydrolase-fold protein [Paeniglutamicibacter sp. NPDC012692]|uniref:alpha/beta hydrolase n=1 Tax=Paeniglutamicibacter sp. NPDC012692 TaxID=3364388 RepID=UPI0036AF2A21